MIVELQRGDHTQRLTYDEFELRIRDGEISPETLVRFDAVTGDAFVPAGSLELYQVLVDPRSLAFRRNLTRPGMPIVTAILVGIQLRIYLLSWAPGAETFLQEEFTNWAPGILERGEVYRLISYGLLHVSFTHLLFNLTFLAYTGYNLERALGRLNLLVLYFGSVFAGGVLSMWMAPDRPSLGASGGDFGLIAAAVIFGWKHWEDIPAAARNKFGWALAPYLGFSLVSGFTVENVDNWGHIGGLIAGAVLMTLLAPEVLSTRIRGNRRVRVGFVGLGVLIAGVLGIYGPRLVPITPRGDDGWTASVPGYWREGWTFTGDRGWFSPTGDATAVIARTVHARPLSADMVADSLIERIGSGGRPPEVLVREAIEVAGQTGRRLVLRFTLSGEKHIVQALVLARGVYAYRAQFQTLERVRTRYSPLSTRVFESAQIAPPSELVESRERARMHPRSWQPAVALGTALYRVGEPTAALAEFERALHLSPGSTEALVGKLRVYADYRLTGGVEIAHEILDAGPADPGVIVAAAEVIYANGEYARAIAVLDAAWVQMPGDRVLRRARLQWALSVELKSTD